MADKWPVTTPMSWSSAVDWNDGILPVDGDDIYADGKQVTIDQAINLPNATIRTRQRSGGTNGGSFILATAYDITLASIRAGLTDCLTITASTGTVNIVADSYAGYETSKSAIRHTGAATVNITGDGYLAGGYGSGTIAIVQNESTGTMNVTGDFGGNSQGLAYYFGWVGNYGTGTLNVVGNGTTSSTSCFVLGSFGSGIVNATGAFASNSYSGNAVYQTAGTINITGTVTAAQVNVGSSAWGITSSGGTCNITGTLNGGYYGCSGAYLSGSAKLNVVGTMQASNGAAVYAYGANILVTLDGQLVSGVSGQPALAMLQGIFVIHATNPQTHTYRVNNSGSPGVARSLYTGGQNLGQPDEADVRDDTTFGVSNEYTGTLAVPPVGSVLLGVPTDDTVGTLVPSMSAADIRAAVGLAFANLDTQLAAIDDYLDTEVAAIKAKTDLIPADLGDQLSGVAGEVWSHGSRTLTMPVAAVLETIRARRTLVLRRGDTISIALTGLGSLAGRENVIFSIKNDKNDADSEAVLRIDETTGLLVIEGAVGTAADASLVVNDEDTGAVTITITPAAAKLLTLLTPGNHDRVWDCKLKIDDDHIYTRADGKAEIEGDVTRDA